MRGATELGEQIALGASIVDGSKQPEGWAGMFIIHIGIQSRRRLRHLFWKAD
jgi:hypothetical protein